MAFFPMMFDLNNKKCLVVGGGRHAIKAIRVLLEFGASVTVVAPSILDAVKDFDPMKVSVINREFVNEDIRAGYTLAIVATGDDDINSSIAFLCKQFRLLVSVEGNLAISDFQVPEYVKESELVGAFSAGGQSKAVEKYMKSQATFINNDLVHISERADARKVELAKQGMSDLDMIPELEAYVEELTSKLL